ncbi:hypothetical protein ACE1B2_06970, partial [Aeromonas veronii]
KRLLKTALRDNYLEKRRQRAGKSSRHFHRELFDRFPNDKHHFTTREAVNSYLTQLTVNS